jgi:hypothetical protein
VHVHLVAEGRHERRVGRQVSQQAQLDLAPVRRHHHPALTRQEGRADALAVLAANRSALQVRLGGDEPPRRAGGLLERAVHAPRARMDGCTQHLCVGVDELRELALAQDLLRDGVLRGEALQHLGVRAVARLGALLHRQLQLVEQHLAQLLGGRQVEGAPGELEDLRLDGGLALLELGAQLGQRRRVHAHASALHVGQHPCERQLEVAHDPRLVLLCQQPLERRTQLLDGQRSGAREGCPRARVRVAQRGPRALGRSTVRRREGGQHALQERPCHLLELVGEVRGGVDEIGRELRVQHHPRERQAVLRQHRVRVACVVHALGPACVGERSGQRRTQRGARVVRGIGVGAAHRHEQRLGPSGQRHPVELGGHRRGPGVEGEQRTALGRRAAEREQRLGRLGQHHRGGALRVALRRRLGPQQ